MRTAREARVRVLVAAAFFVVAISLAARAFPADVDAGAADEGPGRAFETGEPDRAAAPLARYSP